MASRVIVIALFAVLFYYTSYGQQILPVMTWNNVVVLGQPNYTSAVSAAPAANTLKAPNAVSVVNGKLIVSDSGNNRIVVYSQIGSLMNNANADICLNAINLNSNGSYPTSAIAGYNRDNTGSYSIFAGDNNNHSVVRYSEPLAFNQQQDNVTVGARGDWSTPNGIAVDLNSNSVYVSDAFFAIVRRYSLNNLNTPIATYGGAATPNITGPGTLRFPTTILLGCSGEFWVVDTYNSRILRYPNGSTSPDLVIGQNDFSTSTTGSGPSQLNRPFGAAIDQSCSTIWVADSSNNRILKFVSPFRTGMNASEQLGAFGGTANNSLSLPYSIAVDTPNNRLWIADYFNNRVLGGTTTNIVAVSPSSSPTVSLTPSISASAVTQSVSLTNSPAALSSGQSASSSATPNSVTPTRSIGSTASTSPSISNTPQSPSSSAAPNSVTPTRSIGSTASTSPSISNTPTSNNQGSGSGSSSNPTTGSSSSLSSWLHVF